MKKTIKLTAATALLSVLSFSAIATGSEKMTKVTTAYSYFDSSNYSTFFQTAMVKGGESYHSKFSPVKTANTYTLGADRYFGLRTEKMKTMYFVDTVPEHGIVSVV